MMQDIHITLTARDIREDDLRGKTAVIIDVLRASSVIITALHNGASGVKTVATVGEALQLRTEGALLGGERNAMKIDGFDLGNSPLEYTKERVEKQAIVLTTTNGTLALSRSRAADEILIGSFINRHSLRGYLEKSAKPLELVCAGTNGEFSLDDFLCAGMICSDLLPPDSDSANDLVNLARGMWTRAESCLTETLSVATHFKILKEKGFQDDLNYCLRTGTHPVTAIYDKSSQMIVRA